MARSEHWVPGSWNDFPYTIDNARHALMYRFICHGGKCDVTPDNRIAETLAKFSGSYRSGCDCYYMYCSPHYSEIGAATSCNHSDTVINDLPDAWSMSDEYIEVTDGSFTGVITKTVPSTSPSLFSSDSESELQSCFVANTDILQNSESQQVNLSSLEQDSQLFSDSEDIEVPRASEYQSLSQSFYTNNMFDECDSDSFSDTETQWPADTVSFSDAETQWPAGTVSFSDAETQWPAGVPYPHLKSDGFIVETVSSD